MDIRMHKFSDKVPEPTLRRLPWYLSNVKLMKEQGETYVSSTQISKQINVDASQIAKDLSYVNISGRTRVGYEIDALIEVLERFLGFTKMHKAFLFGVGSLGGALLRDSGLLGVEGGVLNKSEPMVLHKQTLHCLIMALKTNEEFCSHFPGQDD